MDVLHQLARRSAALCFSLIIPFLGISAFAAVPDSIQVDPENRRVEIPGKVAPQDVYEQLKGVIEYVATSDGGKKYESLFILQPRAEAIFEATRKIGLVRGKPAYDDDSGAHYLPIGQPVRLLVRWETNGEVKEHRVEDFVTNEQNTETMPHCEWTYIGSEMVDDPSGDQKVPQVAVSQNVIALHHQDQWVLIQNPLESATDQSAHHTNTELLPPAGTSITLVIEAPKPPEGMERIHAFLTGRVQGVGFRNFTQRAARQLHVKGWVKNLDDGRVELVAEGDKAVLEKFMEYVRRGPRPAKVDNVEVNPEPPTNMFRDFLIEY